jgi:hypothetical protein
LPIHPILDIVTNQSVSCNLFRKSHDYYYEGEIVKKEENLQ